MLKIYALVAAVITLLLDLPFEIFQKSYSWWLVPVLLIGIFVVLVLLHCIVLLFSVLIVNLDKPPHDTDFFRALVKTFLRMALPILRVKVHTTGLKKIPEGEPFLLVSNHTHNLDPAIIYYAVPDSRIAFVAKKEVRELYPFVYKALHKLNGLPLDRENNRDAAKVIINASKLIKEKTNSVAIFPEGYVSKDGQLQPIRNGALKIATKAKAKIVVCTIWGVKDVPKNLLRRRTDVYFDVLEVIDTAENPHTVELGEQIHTLMEESLQNRK